jgi:hypothetical protein
MGESIVVRKKKIKRDGILTANYFHKSKVFEGMFRGSPSPIELLVGKVGGQLLQSLAGHLLVVASPEGNFGCLKTNENY